MSRMEHNFLSSSWEGRFEDLDQAIADDLDKNIVGDYGLLRGPIIHPGEDGKVRFTNVYAAMHSKGDEDNKVLVFR